MVQGFVRVVFGEILSRVLLGEGPFKTFERVRVEQIINVMWLARWVVGHSLGRRAWGSVWGGGDLHGRIGLVGCRTRAKLVRMGGLPNLEPQRCLLYNLAEGPSNRDAYPVKVRRIRTQCCVPTGVTVTPIDSLPPTPFSKTAQNKLTFDLLSALGLLSPLFTSPLGRGCRMQHGRGTFNHKLSERPPFHDAAQDQLIDVSKSVGRAAEVRLSVCPGP